MRFRHRYATSREGTHRQTRQFKVAELAVCGIVGRFRMPRVRGERASAVVADRADWVEAMFVAGRGWGQGLELGLRASKGLLVWCDHPPCKSLMRNGSLGVRRQKRVTFKALQAPPPLPSGPRSRGRFAADERTAPERLGSGSVCRKGQ